MESTQRALFEEIGGRAAVEAVVGDFYRRVLADPALAPLFAATDMDRLRHHQAAFVTMVLGGPAAYEGRTMRTAHAGRGIEDRHFDAVAGHLGAALRNAGVGATHTGTILGAVGGLRDDVVGV